MKPKEEARNASLKLWAHRIELWGEEVDEEQVVREGPEMYVKHFSSLQLERTMELKGKIPNDRGIGIAHIAGRINPNSGTIAIAKAGASPESQRFTLAHEIGHMLMHSGRSLNRERSIGSSSETRRPQEEREADEFAAEFLMPSKMVRKAFAECFGAPIDGTILDLDLAYKLSAATSQHISARDLLAYTPMERAMIVSRVSAFGASIFEPLCKRFLVSSTAMAKKLLELGLVH